MKGVFNVKAQMTHIALHVKDAAVSAAFYEEWCGMVTVHERDSSDGGKVVWVASPGQEDDFVIVLVGGASGTHIGKEGVRHIGLAVESEDAVRNMTERARAAGILHWDYQEQDFPVGTLCAIKDPDGHIVEFSYGQPLGKDFKNRKEEGPAR